MTRFARLVAATLAWVAICACVPQPGNGDGGGGGGGGGPGPNDTCSEVTQCTNGNASWRACCGPGGGTECYYLGDDGTRFYCAGFDSGGQLDCHDAASMLSQWCSGR
jgi:hypothetical protein